MANAIDSSVRNNMNIGAAGTQKKDAAQDLNDSFMTLLVTQLQNQDPLNPMENAEMTSQLAQINTVSGIQDLNENLEAISGQIDAGKALQAAALIGKGVLVPGDHIIVGEASEDGVVPTTPFGIELGGPADEVTVTITNKSGEVVRRYTAEDVGALDAGVHSFAWDGMLGDGSKTPAPKGSYTVTVEASMAGEPVAVNKLGYAQVFGVTTSDSGPLLDLGGLQDQVRLEDVRQIL